MDIRQVYLFCNYTTRDTRSHLHLSTLKEDNFIRRILGLPKLKYTDAAPWIESFISFFKENRTAYTLHIVALQVGMKMDEEQFLDEGIHYHYIKSGLGVFQKILDKLFYFQRRNDYPEYRRRFESAIRAGNPDLAILCGAENPDYATAFMQIRCPHKLVIMQTLMNDKKRITMGISSNHRRSIEDRVLKQCRFFAVPDLSWNQYIEKINPNATCFSFTFPTVKPIVNHVPQKAFDVVFFAGILGRYKGTNDLVTAMSMLCSKLPRTTLNIIGGADQKYMNDLHQQVIEYGLTSNIFFTPSFDRRVDVFSQVCKANYVVLPGITASLNSTVRESMLMGMPTITYETTDTRIINSERQCVLTAKMEDIKDLADKLEYAITHQDEMYKLALNGKAYAESHFSQEAFNNCFSRIISKVLE